MSVRINRVAPPAAPVRPDWNTYPQYTVTYAGDATHVPGTATVMVEFVG